MSDELFYFLQVASTFSVALPLIVGILRSKNLDYVTNLFLVFLAVGFTVDLCGWYLATIGDKSTNLKFRHGYDLFEAIFFSWIVFRSYAIAIFKRFFPWLLAIIFVAWLWRFVNYDAIAVFKTTTQVLIAFAASHSLLQLIEGESDIVHNITFYILLGIFFYCFSTFFIMALLATKLTTTWYVHAFINITTNIVYFVGFLISKRRSASF